MRTISAKVSDIVHQEISDLSRKNNITISTLIKQSILNSEIIDVKKDRKIDINKLKELNRIGNNLNQISKHFNSFKNSHSVEYFELEKILKIIKKKVEKL